MFSTIVVGTDGSSDAKRALSVAADLASHDDGADVHVVAAYHPLSASEIRRLSEDLPEEFHPLLHGHMSIDAIRDGAKRELLAAGIEASYHEVANNPTDAILDVAERVEADLILLGSRGEGMAKRLIHGSVSTSVFHHARCAVLVVKADD